MKDLNKLQPHARLPRHRSIGSRGFTLVELLVAMAATLLLMAGLAKSFAVISASIKEGRGRLTLSSQLRNLSFRLRSDLNSRTVVARPPQTSASGAGYFMYYEGPLTEHTFGLFGASPQRTLPDGSVVTPFNPVGTTNASNFDPNYVRPDAGPTYRRYSRFGDFDDYVAFTAQAPGEDWFTGKVPAYLVDDSVVDNPSTPLDERMEPRVIRSKHAEIIIWASPDWSVDPATNGLNVAPHPSAMPLYRDDNRDFVPDRVVLHQRILLIRPDLNLDRIVPGTLPFSSPVLRPLLANSDPSTVPLPLANVYPIGAPFSPQYARPGSSSDNREMLSSNWLNGMAPLHHFFDLSLRRVIHPVTGDPTGFVAANSLETLVHPHNRFAHVRYPGRYFGRGSFSSPDTTSDNATSMPLLALGWNDAILNWQGTVDPRDENPSATPPAWFPSLRQPSPLTLNLASSASGRPECGLFNGWLLPHFELGDANPAVVGGVTSGEVRWKRGYLVAEDPRWDRSGEDVIAPNILAFDVRGFDPTAPVFLTCGPDGAPGRASFDDDGVGGIDQTHVFTNSWTGRMEASSELGTPGSDDQTVGVSDLGMYGLFGQNILNPLNPNAAAAYRNQSKGSEGDFVDLLYPYLAGSPLLERTGQAHASSLISASTPPSPVAFNSVVFDNYSFFLRSQLSLFPMPVNGQNSLKRSGKLVHWSTGDICFMQPTYDTWTDLYESDGFDQSPTQTGVAVGAPLIGTTWVLNDFGQTPRLPVNASNRSYLQVDTGQHADAEPETSPPFNVDLQAVQITIRVQDPATEEMSQISIVQGLQ